MKNYYKRLTSLALSATLIAALFASACKKNEESPDDKDDAPKIEYGVVNDVEGRVCKTVKIGTQWWMAENLKVRKFNNGDEIVKCTDPGTWSYAVNSYYCDYNNDSVQGLNYGRLYNFKVISDSRGICPTGWHVPDNSDWQALISYAGGMDYAGGRLKQKGTTKWQNPNTGATDSLGFEALPSGGRESDGIFFGLNRYAIWWAAAEYDSLSAWNWTFAYDNIKVYKSTSFQSAGFCIRCIKTE